MSHLGLLTSNYMQFLAEIEKNQGVPCESIPIIFFPDDISDPDLRQSATKAAKTLCKSCPLVQECLTYALESNQRHGIWGATEPHER
jgi:WhiB family redox-sensing transcriptional regulator